MKTKKVEKVISTLKDQIDHPFKKVGKNKSCFTNNPLNGDNKSPGGTP